MRSIILGQCLDNLTPFTPQWTILLFQIFVTLLFFVLFHGENWARSVSSFKRIISLPISSAALFFSIFIFHSSKTGKLGRQPGERLLTFCYPPASLFSLDMLFHIRPAASSKKVSTIGPGLGLMCDPVSRAVRLSAPLSKEGGSGTQKKDL